MNAKSMPRAPLIIIGGNLAVLDMHPDEHGLSIARMLAATT
jgi:hypothetical protein